jgi:formyltetrahydrofolate-dependent phosphoribosylglycinamide formyltransferase
LADTRTPVAVLISGRGSNFSALHAASLAPGYPARIALVVSNRADAPGLALAQAVGVATAVIDHRAFRGDRAGFDAAMDARLRVAGVRLVALAGFMRLLTAGFVDAWRDRLVNIHPSLLPAFPGLDTHARALTAGVKLHGATVHLVRAEMDSGPILAQGAVAVLGDDTEATLAARVLAVEHTIYPVALAWLAAGRVRVSGAVAVVEAPGAAGRLVNPVADGPGSGGQAPSPCPSP